MLGHALFHTYELSIPVFVVAWLDAFQATEATLGWAVGAGYALVGLGALPSGVLSDTYESRTLIIIGILGMGAGFGALSIAPNILWIALALVLWGAAASLYHPAALALLSRGTHQRGTAFAYHGAAGNVGTVIGPLASALLLVFFHWRTVTGLFVVPALLGGIIALRIDFDEVAAVKSTNTGKEKPTSSDGGVDESDSADPEWQRFLNSTRSLFSGGFIVVFVIVMLYGLYYRGVLTFLPDVLSDLPLFRVIEFAGATFHPGQYVYAGLLLVGIAGQYVGGTLTDTNDTVRLLVGVFIGLVVCTLVFIPASRTGLVPLLIVCIVLGFLLYAAAPIYQATIAEHVTSELRGLSYGYTYLSMFGVGALGAALAGGILTYAGTVSLFVILASIIALASLLCVRLLWNSMSILEIHSDTK